MNWLSLNERLKRYHTLDSSSAIFGFQIIERMSMTHHISNIYGRCVQNKFPTSIACLKQVVRGRLHGLDLHASFMTILHHTKDSVWQESTARYGAVTGYVQGR